MLMVHILIKKETYLLRFSILKYSSSYSNKDNCRKPYHKKYDTSINVLKIEKSR